MSVPDISVEVAKKVTAIGQEMKSRATNKRQQGAEKCRAASTERAARRQELQEII